MTTTPATMTTVIVLGNSKKLHYISISVPHGSWSLWHGGSGTAMEMQCAGAHVRFMEGGVGAESFQL